MSPTLESAKSASHLKGFAGSNETCCLTKGQPAWRCFPPEKEQGFGLLQVLGGLRYLFPTFLPIPPGDFSECEMVLWVEGLMMTSWFSTPLKGQAPMRPQTISSGYGSRAFKFCWPKSAFLESKLTSHLSSCSSREPLYSKHLLGSDVRRYRWFSDLVSWVKNNLGSL